ncbi:hypothetical protein HMPREF3038_00287 [Akkermansia sp. KLE1797]|nr:hypothetical protein HMPREF3038_00287 [Akkermansia sp. KLE1797]KXU54962.1 hypothetical protein HMPREF3039_00843 [Akkermansia sp. KLE1798]
MYQVYNKHEESPPAKTLHADDMHPLDHRPELELRNTLYKGGRTSQWNQSSSRSARSSFQSSMNSRQRVGSAMIPPFPRP